MFADFFIKRPVFASVCALIIILVGAISIPSLPIERFPDISPTQINVTANYSGASAEIVENAVTNILERQINFYLLARLADYYYSYDHNSDFFDWDFCFY